MKQPLTIQKVNSLLFVALLCMAFGCAKRVPLPSDRGAGVQAESVHKSDLISITTIKLPKDTSDRISSRIHSEVIYPGDELEVVIYEKLPVSEEKRFEKKRISEDGKIVIPPVGEIEIAGFSVITAQKLIEEKLAPYIVSPFCEIFISKRRYEPQVYLFGEIAKNGTVPYTKGDRLIDAISMGGGCKEDAYRRSIKLIRATGDSVSVYSINLINLMRDGRLDLNIPLQDQDIIFVPRRFLTNYKEVISALSLVMPSYYILRLLAPHTFP